MEPPYCQKLYRILQRDYKVSINNFFKNNFATNNCDNKFIERQFDAGFRFSIEMSFIKFVNYRYHLSQITKWQNNEPTEVPDIDDVVSLLKDHTPATASIGQIKSSLKHVNTRKTTGADGIPAWLLNRFHKALAPVVHDIISCSIKESKFPASYKHTLITPMDHSPFKLILHLGRKNEIFRHSQKEHVKTSKIAKFGGETL